MIKEVQTMSNKELAKQIIDQIPESKMLYVIAYLQGAAVPDDMPNADTIEAFQEIDSGGGHTYQGSTKDLINELMED